MNRRWVKQCATGFLLVTGNMFSTCAGEPAIRAIVSDTNTPPYAIFNQYQQLVGGLSKDILDELASLMQREVSYLDLPRARVEQWLHSGEADIACFLNPDWVEQPDKLLWSPPLFVTRQLFLRLVGNPSINTLVDLAGKRVGTTRGFTYPELEQVFSLGDVVRDDSHSLQSNIKRLKQGRLDVVMSVDLSFYYYQQTLQDADIVADPIWTEPPGVFCALSSQDIKRAMAFHQGLQQLVDSGFIQQRLNFYTATTINIKALDHP